MIYYDDLSFSLKVAVVLAWITGILTGLGFLAGFFGAL
jgi:hypothetical protein